MVPTDENVNHSHLKEISTTGTKSIITSKTVQVCCLLLYHYIGGSNYRIQFFRFHKRFRQKAPTSEVSAPPNGKSWTRNCTITIKYFQNYLYCLINFCINVLVRRMARHVYARDWMGEKKSTKYSQGRSRISRSGAWARLGGGRGPPMRVLFGENACENERIGSRKGGGVRRKILYVDPPMTF